MTAWDTEYSHTRLNCLSPNRPLHEHTFLAVPMIFVRYDKKVVKSMSSSRLKAHGSI